MTRTDSERRVALVDLLDRVLAGGVVITGDIKLSIADVDMVQISLRALISSVSALDPARVRLAQRTGATPG
ncbi:gas vesicle protein [Nocardia xishanensis]|uniref:gas vesicle protein n=1 Tax=Nocardia xishanensis TaxID=238964 RepID=UPI0008345E5D|nr:gas vesicle protein [Nocardia xishanensis]